MSVQFHSHPYGEFEREGNELVADDDLAATEVRMYPLQHGSSYRRSLFACPQCSRRDFCSFLLKIGLLSILVLAGFLVGYYGAVKRPCFLADTINDYDTFLVQQTTSRVDAGRIRDTVQQLSKKAHFAGTNANNALGEWINSQVKSFYNFSSRLYPYKVTLQHPNVIYDPNGTPISANVVELLDAANNTVSTCADCAPQLNGFVPFTAYSTVGEFVGEPVYINFGRNEDFEKLRNASIDCSKRVLIARLGEETRASIAWRALYDYCRSPGDPIAGSNQPRLALLVYPDPAVYPAALPNETSAGMNRFISAFGDPRTPGLPSISKVNREDFIEFLRDQPDVLIQPISWQYAAALLKNMAGPVFDDADWKGKLPDVKYAVGPGYLSSPQRSLSTPSTGYRIRVKVTNIWSPNTGNDEGTAINNIITVAPGTTERDRYVIIGAHYDALSCGARDNGGSVAALLEIMRVLHEFYRFGRWKPRRSVVFAFWDAEEYGQIGSTEFIEELGVELKDRAVAYVNLDGIVSGTNRFVANEHPLFFNLLANVTREFDWPSSPGTSIVHRWLVDLVVDLAGTQPPLGQLYSPLDSKQQSVIAELIDEQIVDSDIMSWWTELGVPFIAPRFVGLTKGLQPLSVIQRASAQSTRGSATVPHSNQDTYETLADTDTLFGFHATIAKIVMMLTHRLADSVLLPVDPIPLASYMLMRFDTMVSVSKPIIHRVDARFGQLGILTKFNALRTALQGLVDASLSYAQRARALERVTGNAFAVRRMNERIMLVDHAFDSEYNKGFRGSKSTLFAADRAYEQRSVQFPGVQVALSKLIKPDSNDAIELEKAQHLARELSIVLVNTQQAARLLLEEDSFFTD